VRPLFTRSGDHSEWQTGLKPRATWEGAPDPLESSGFTVLADNDEFFAAIASMWSAGLQALSSNAVSDRPGGRAVVRAVLGEEL